MCKSGQYFIESGAVKLKKWTVFSYKSTVRVYRGTGAPRITMGDLQSVGFND